MFLNWEWPAITEVPWKRVTIAMAARRLTQRRRHLAMAAL
jgi:hypothetical protein